MDETDYHQMMCELFRSNEEWQARNAAQNSNEEWQGRDAASGDDEEEYKNMFREFFGVDEEAAGAMGEAGEDESDERKNGEAAGAMGEAREDESDEREDGEAAAAMEEARGKAKAKGKAKGKAKAKAAPKAKGKAKGKAKAKAKAMVQGPRVGDAEPNPKAKAKSAPGAAGTFAGRRCPANAVKRSNFDELKAHYMQARLEAMKTTEEASGSKSSTEQSTEQTKRKFSDNQQKYWAAMKKRMQELAKAGVPGPERMRLAAADWKTASVKAANVQ